MAAHGASHCFRRLAGQMMAYRLPRPCLVPLCAELTDSPSGRCPKHGRIKNDQQLRHDNDRKFYKSARWLSLRKMILARHPLCAICGKPATVVDHIVPRRQGGGDTDHSNLQSLCARCHNVKRAAEGRGGVWG